MGWRRGTCLFFEPQVCYFISYSSDEACRPSQDVRVLSWPLEKCWCCVASLCCSAGFVILKLELYSLGFLWLQAQRVAQICNKDFSGLTCMLSICHKPHWQRDFPSPVLQYLQSELINSIVEGMASINRSSCCQCQLQNHQRITLPSQMHDSIISFCHQVVSTSVLFTVVV